MRKFTQINESKVFMPNPAIIKKYASFIVPMYLNGKLKCDESLIDEYLEMNRKSVRAKNANIVCELEILAVKAVVANPTTQTGYETLEAEIADKCPKLEKFLRNIVTDPKLFV